MFAPTEDICHIFLPQLSLGTRDATGPLEVRPWRRNKAQWLLLIRIQSRNAQQKTLRVVIDFNSTDIASQNAQNGCFASWDLWSAQRFSFLNWTQSFRGDEQRQHQQAWKDCGRAIEAFGALYTVLDGLFFLCFLPPAALWKVCLYIYIYVCMCIEREMHTNI